MDCQSDMPQYMRERLSKTADRGSIHFLGKDHEKMRHADRMVDIIRKRYGKDAVKRAVFINQPLDHIAGGISKEKQIVDYSRVYIL